MGYTMKTLDSPLIKCNKNYPACFNQLLAPAADALLSMVEELDINMEVKGFFRSVA